MIVRRINQPLFREFDWFGREFDRMAREMNTLFSSNSPSGNHVWWEKNDDGVTVSAELPGLNPENIDINLEARNLTISGEAAAIDLDDDSRYIRRERQTAGFKHTLTLPYTIDAEGIEASYSDGILTIELPRAEADKPRKIAVKNS